jgi:hypothetical protein
MPRGGRGHARGEGLRARRPQRGTAPVRRHGQTAPARYRQRFRAIGRVGDRAGEPEDSASGR